MEVIGQALSEMESQKLMGFMLKTKTKNKFRPFALMNYVATSERKMGIF